MANTGGPAFPCPSPYPGTSQHGMSLRDYFAVLAMQGLITRYECVESCAREAYRQADAMLKERDKE